MKLKITALKVAELEEDLNTSIQELMWDTKLSTIAKIISKTLDKENKVGVSEEEAYDEIDKYLAVKGNSINSLMFLIMGEFKKTGFLNPELDMEKILKAYNKQMKEVMKNI